MKAGNLIHTAKIYQEINTKAFGGTTEKSLALVKTVKCSIEDITYKNKVETVATVFSSQAKFIT